MCCSHRSPAIVGVTAALAIPHVSGLQSLPRLSGAFWAQFKLQQSTRCAGAVGRCCVRSLHYGTLPGVWQLPGAWRSQTTTHAATTVGRYMSSVAPLCQQVTTIMNSNWVEVIVTLAMRLEMRWPEMQQTDMMQTLGWSSSPGATSGVRAAGRRSPSAESAGR